MPVSHEDFESALAERLGEESVRRLAEARVGIAGLGGLGSNIALLLARSGVGELVVADYDTVDLTNIHRQCYPLECIGMRKTDALEAEISRVNPWCRIEKHHIRLLPDNLGIFDGCGIEQSRKMRPPHRTERSDEVEVKRLGVLADRRFPGVTGSRTRVREP